nr:hypothetical protein [uncultured Rhodoferax sp.]
MPHIVFAWEIGSGFGHLVPMAALSQALLQRGHRVSAIVPASSAGRQMLEPLGITVLDAPVTLAPPHTFALSINYAANLLRNGYWHGPTLAQRLTDWRISLGLLQPDLLVTDHAPAALLASRFAIYPRAAIGNGFTLPPLCLPMPGLQAWFPVSDSYLAKVEQQWLDSVNAALVTSKSPPLTSLASLFDGVERFFCIEPELDHYATRTSECYLNAIEPTQILPPPPEMSDGSCVFVYLSSHNRFLKSVLSALRTRGIPTLAYISGTNQLAEAEPSGSSIRYLSGLVDLKLLGGRCRLAIIHGGTLSASLFLKQGVKLLICPEDLEKAVLAQRLLERKLAFTLNWFSPDDLQPATRLDAILAAALPPGLADFVARHQASPTASNASTIVNRLDAMLVNLTN